MRILMVCLGNICRSPLAEGILAHKAKKLGLDWIIDSAGTGGWHKGELPDSRSIRIARQYGIDITNQRARQFTAADFQHFDLIFAMDTQNHANMVKLAKSPTEIKKVHLLLDLTYPNENRNVPDPYYDDQGFEHVFQLIDSACEVLIENLTS
jgi:protein-tyrosine phosphatase